MTTIGQRIAYYRKKANLTQEELAEKCSVTPQAVSKWENDISAPDISLFPRACKALQRHLRRAFRRADRNPQGRARRDGRPFQGAFKTQNNLARRRYSQPQSPRPGCRTLYQECKNKRFRHSSKHRFRADYRACKERRGGQTA